MFAFLATSFLLVHLVCGNTLSRIINGQDTTIAKHPHQVSLQNKSGSHKCGASIIDNQWVLTAAHCVSSTSANSDTVALNDGTRSNKVVYAIDKVIIHPQYNKGSGAFPNDVALLKLKTAMNFNDFNHGIISLANTGEDFGTTRCTITGWGNTEFGTLPTTLKETTGNILPNCGEVWGSNYVATAHICIDNPNSGACNGDSGGPMVCDGKLAGVTSWGASGCTTSLPSVYARISTYRTWIDDTMSSN